MKYYCKCGLEKTRQAGRRKRLVCKPCDGIKHKKYREENKERLKIQKSEYRAKHPEKWRNRNLVKNYGITLDQYNQILIKQNNVCAICLKPEANRSKRYKNLATDHHHVTKKVRGLLCNKCNRAIGLLGDSIDIALNLTEYLIINR